MNFVWTTRPWLWVAQCGQPVWSLRCFDAGSAFTRHTNILSSTTFQGTYSGEVADVAAGTVALIMRLFHCGWSIFLFRFRRNPLAWSMLGKNIFLCCDKMSICFFTLEKSPAWRSLNPTANIEAKKLPMWQNLLLGTPVQDPKATSTCWCHFQWRLTTNRGSRFHPWLSDWMGWCGSTHTKNTSVSYIVFKDHQVE